MPKIKGKALCISLANESKNERTVTMTCSICRLRGHNKLYHFREDAPVDDWVEAELESIESPFNLAVNAQGKMVAARGKGSSSQHVHEKHQMQFKPTPMVARETQTGMLRSGPAATLVDALQDIDEAESSNIESGKGTT